MGSFQVRQSNRCNKSCKIRLENEALAASYIWRAFWLCNSIDLPFEGTLASAAPQLPALKQWQLHPSQSVLN